ncbi:MAG TPA: maleylpyruvate isomerase N-terminal domain-containing protein [Candidatus Saccharimonadia bacterium]|nr:maleylpyruvate isomerase N-terminal domain-containing protein [Candidatus Saccharimonadia bacterium]
MIREADESAGGLFVNTGEQVGPTQWEQPGLGVWTVRDLVGHTSRALLTVELYLAKPVAQREVTRPVDYFLHAQAGLADPASVAARGREAGVALGPDPMAVVRDIAARVLAQVKTASDEVLVGTPVGGMRLIDYLPSRIFELAVHTLDIAAALPVTVTLPETVAAVALHLLADMALQPDKAATLLLAATGRRALPAGFRVL